MSEEKSETPTTVELAPCPCGRTPGALIMEMGERSKWGRVMGDCCSEWSVEFRNGYTDKQEVSLERASSAWNDAPRG